MPALADIVRRASQSARRVFGVMITYTPEDGSPIGPFPATVGTSDFTIDEGNGTSVMITTRDYIIDTNILKANGVMVEPKRGDTIAEGGYSYNVSLGSTKAAPWKWLDTTRTQRRVHCQQTGVPS